MQCASDAEFADRSVYFQANENQLAVLADFDLERKANDSESDVSCKRFLAALKTSIEQGEPVAGLEELGVVVIQGLLEEFPEAIHGGLSDAFEMLVHQPKVPCALNDEYKEMIAVAIDRTLSEHSLVLNKEERVKLEREFFARASVGLSILETPREVR